MLTLDGGPLALADLERIGRGEAEVGLGTAARERMAASRQVIEAILASGENVYGVDTGFGKLSDVRIAPADLARLQLNLVRSHACGVGPPLPDEAVRVMLALRANVLAKGLSGARPLVAERLLEFLAAEVLPVVPSRGSVGASGDLAPLAHLALALIGEGRCRLRGEDLPTAEALARAGPSPLALEAKEGLALLNGTQAMVAVGGLALARALRLVDLADAAGATTLEALLGTPSAFDARIHEARPHPGQIRSAARLRDLLADSEIRESHRRNDPRVQDAYSLRCMPQVHGAAWGALEHARAVVETETGAATDNPLVFGSEVISGGNFHGAPLGYAFDYAALALTDLASMSERRIDRLVNPDLSEGLPPFLTRDAGTSSGLMIPHVTAAALLSEAKVLGHPASVDSVPTSGGKEDHVSMGMTSALKLEQVVGLAERVLAIELIAACQGLEFRRPLRAGRGVEGVYESVRTIVAPLTEDRPWSEDIERLATAIRAGALVSP